MAGNDHPSSAAAHTHFRRMSDNGEDNNEPIAGATTLVDDFFDTSTSANNSSNNNKSSSGSQYHSLSERFIFDGDEEGAIISPSSPTSPYCHDTTTEPLLHGEHNDEDNDGDDEHLYRLRLPFARRQSHRQENHRRPDLSGLNILNLVTFVAFLVVSILWGSGLVETAMRNHHHGWLPSPWTVTNMAGYETLLTPALWAGDYIWIPVLVFECIFALVQLLPAVRTRPEVVSGVGYFWFYIGMLEVMATMFFCLKWVIPAWFALAVNAACLVLLHIQRQQSFPLNNVTEWEYWVFRFPFDLHLGWLLPLLASRGSMIFRCYGIHDMGGQLAADIVCMGLLLPCAGACLMRGQGPPDWVIPLLILWAYIGIACRLLHTPEALIDAYGIDIVVAVRDAAWTFAGAVGLMVIPNTVVWVARECLTIQVVQLSDEEEDGSEVDGLVMNDPSEAAGMHTADF